MIKRSRQREAIRQCLTGRYDHPTAETVYIILQPMPCTPASVNSFQISVSELFTGIFLFCLIWGRFKKLLSVEARTDLTETRHRITTFLAESVDV